MDLTTPETANKEPAAPNTCTSKMKTVGKKESDPGCGWNWLTGENVSRDSAVRKPTPTSQLLLGIHFFPLSPFLLTFNLPSALGVSQFLLKQFA